jgi:hypothetical protein
METARPSGGAWSRKVRLLVAALTLAGLMGIPITYLGLLFGSGKGFSGGCGGFAAVGLLVILGFSLVVLFFVGLVGVVAVVGLVLFWKRSLAGPLLLFIANLLSMVFFGWIGWMTHGDPRYQFWAEVGLLLGAAPAIAAGLVVWPLLKGEVALKRVRERIAMVAVLGAVAVVPVGSYLVGLASELSAVLATPPHIVASVGCGPSPSAGLPAGALVTTTR